MVADVDGSSAGRSGNDRTGSAERAANADERNVMRDTGANRQILVSGFTPAGLLLTAYLDRAGYDPLLVSDRNVGEHTVVSEIRQPGLELLDRLGAGDALRADGQVLDALDITARGGQPPDDTWRTSLADDATPPRLVTWSHVVEAIEPHLPDENVRPDWHVRDSSNDDDGIHVEFDNGVRELFDVVVATDAERPDRPRDTWNEFDQDVAWLSQIECELPVPEYPDSNRSTVLTESEFGQVIPVPSSGGVRLRLMATCTPRSDPTSIDAWRETTPELFTDEVDRLLRTAEITAVRQGAVPQVTGAEGRWRTGRIAHCGGSAYPVARASGFGLSLQVEDAWVLADELVHGSRSARDALEAYAKRRRRRVRDLLQRGCIVTYETGYPRVEQPEPLATVTRLHATAMTTCRPEVSEEILTDVPERL